MKLKSGIGYELEKKDVSRIGCDIHDFIKGLYPICRSITGDGVRATLKKIGEHIPIKIIEVPTGKKVFDWVIPKEWNIRDAYVKNGEGKKIIDMKKSNLHVLNYSMPIHKKMRLAELKEHLFTIPSQPDLVPYFTSYYKENWGFCISHKQYTRLKEDIYEVHIDSEFKDGSLTFGEMYVKGLSKDEVLFSTYICHPSLCNDNLSGIGLLTALGVYIKNSIPKYSYRFLFVPETIGSIAWLYLNREKVRNIKLGLVATCVGDGGDFTYKKARCSDALIDKIALKALKDSKIPYKTVDFFPAGSDERQYSSPGFNLPVGSLMRTMYGDFPQYHNSADDLNFIKPIFLGESFEEYARIIYIIENDATYLNKKPYCEPQLGRRGLYDTVGGKAEVDVGQLSLLSVLNYSDGKTSLLDISIRSGIVFDRIKQAADILCKAKLLKKIGR